MTIDDSQKWSGMATLVTWPGSPLDSASPLRSVRNDTGRAYATGAFRAVPPQLEIVNWILEIPYRLPAFAFAFFVALFFCQAF